MIWKQRLPPLSVVKRPPLICKRPLMLTLLPLTSPEMVFNICEHWCLVNQIKMFWKWLLQRAPNVPVLMLPEVWKFYGLQEPYTHRSWWHLQCIMHWCFFCFTLHFYTIKCCIVIPLLLQDNENLIHSQSVSRHFFFVIFSIKVLKFQRLKKINWKVLGIGQVQFNFIVPSL